MSAVKSNFIPYEPDRLDSLVDGETVGESNPKISGGRFGSRAAAVQALYESDASGHPALTAVSRVAHERNLSEEDTNFAIQLVSECENQRAELDQKIQQFAVQFPTEQMPMVERNVLRVAITELNMKGAAENNVVANEAVELARLFGAHTSPKFINGVLGALLR